MSAHKKNKEDLLNKQMIVRLTIDEYYEFKKYCLENHITINAFLRSLIKNAIKK
ncbi:hypothetical protein [Spiroplasma endosymbiont of Nebria brevicollis]|uniref:hypothetical protein n=1 Tax=Spiroplasma endosymbiont of Nebria brevicollis TaxID=3066284 RepID=UPI00313BEC58